MSDLKPTLSIRLPHQSLQRLDEAAKASQLSRSMLIQKALDRYLIDIMQQVAPTKGQPLEHLLSLRGAGMEKAQPRTTEEIDASIRWLRGDD